MGQKVGGCAMKFDSLPAFFAMDGHGAYVWLAYGITLLAIVLSLWLPALTRRAFVQSEKRLAQRAAVAENEGETP